MNILILTNEYPPNVYGGAGVHVEYLTRELAALIKAKPGGEDRIEVLSFGRQDEEKGPLKVKGIEPEFAIQAADGNRQRLLNIFLKDLFMAGVPEKIDIVHCHTWYTHLAGFLIKELLNAPLVLTTHSLEPHRPWKEEQLGMAYRLSTWVERMAYQNADGVIAVSEGMRRDVEELYGVPPEKIQVIHNGIDAEEYRYKPNPDVLKKYGIDSDAPYVLFVGRITRQKGLVHFLEMGRYLDPNVQLVLCAGAPDTKEIFIEMSARVEALKKERKGKVIWIAEMLPKEDLIPIYSQAYVFVCPSVYEPFGLINLEAMACGTPVVASKVGGIPEAVADSVTGYLIPFEPISRQNPEPRDPEELARKLAGAVNGLLHSREKRDEMGRKARLRVEREFSWRIIAEKTFRSYRKLVDARLQTASI
jgi:starch synthase